jgi:hypothetical protein
VQADSATIGAICVNRVCGPATLHRSGFLRRLFLRVFAERALVDRERPRPLAFAHGRTRINDRRYSQDELGKALHKVVAYAKCIDARPPMTARGITGRLISSIGKATLTGTYGGTYMPSTFAKATAIGGLPVPVVAIALPRFCWPLFSRPGIKEFQSVAPDLFSPRAYARERGRRSSQCAGRAAAAGCACSVDFVLLGEGLVLASDREAGALRGVDDVDRSYPGVS